MRQKKSETWQRFTLWMWFVLLCSVSTGGHLRCTCPAEPGEEKIIAEDPPDEPTPEPDAADREAVFECPNLLDKACKSDDDCRGPKPPPPKKPYCPNLFCADDAVHGRNVSTDPTKPGSLPWNRGFYPQRDHCECKISCANLVCINNTCQVPPAEPLPEIPPPPDQPPSCPESCQTNADCPERLCSDRTTCDPTKKQCINPFVKPP